MPSSSPSHDIAIYLFLVAFLIICLENLIFPSVSTSTIPKLFRIHLNHDVIYIETLLKSHDDGFKIVPISNDSKTPAIKSTNEVYDNPNYWTVEKLKQEHHRFRNVATTFGKTHLKDENGEDLYLHGLDIDSDNVLGILFDLLEELKSKTFVTKTKKGYHVYWLSHKQYSPIGTTKCRSGYE